ncbi:type II secretion system protein [Photobacterium leiognathi]|uniref:type II secretion system protein n=1 Tax=Photobacterium leiognathi TaxID=553611 RepID=UPI0029812C55|nr:type II secretion system protein [Photobacterium leiognathi]
MKKNGFTLIELVVVIVILGILAVVAAPKFMNLQVDARNASLKGLEGAIGSAFNAGYGKMVIAGLEHRRYVSNANKDCLNNDCSDFNPMQSLPFPGCQIGGPDYCVFQYGYPRERDTLSKLVTNLDGNNEWEVVTSTYNGQHALQITFKQFTKKSPEPNTNGDYPTIIDRDNCFITYAPPVSENASYTLTMTPCK